MTLILTIGNKTGVYQTSDYQLIDAKTGRFAMDRAGSKQLQASFKTVRLELAFTGVASVPAGFFNQRTIDWLARELKRLPPDASTHQICDALAHRSAVAMKPLGQGGVLTLVLTIATLGKPFQVAVISNQNWNTRPLSARDRFVVNVRTVSRPMQLISGYHDAVPETQRHRLKALARKTDASQSEIMDALAEINSISASHSKGWVSEGCWVTSQISDGRVRRSAAINVRQHSGGIPQIFSGVDLGEYIKKNFCLMPGQELRIVQAASAIAGPGDGIPTPPPRGGPISLKITGGSRDCMLRAPDRIHCASLEISVLEGDLQVTCNAETVTLPFAMVRFKGTCHSHSPFPRPLYPWPTASASLEFDGAAVARGCEFSIGYWIDGDKHCAAIPQTCRSIRNLPFLKDDEELIVSVPTETVQFTWGLQEDGPAEVLQASVSLRMRADGTRG